MDKNNEIVVLINKNELEVSTSNNLMAKFLPFFETAKEWEQKSKEIVVTNILDIALMEKAKEHRIHLRDIRIEAEITRKALKQDSLNYGRVVDGVYKIIESVIKPLETHLHNQEKFKEI